jgi:hypothetical protein
MFKTNAVHSTFYFVRIHLVVPWLRRLVRVVFMVYKVALGRVSLRVTNFSAVNIIKPWVSTLIYHLVDEQKARKWPPFRDFIDTNDNRIHFEYYPPFMTRSASNILQPSFPTEILYAFLISPKRFTLSPASSPLIFGAEYKLWSAWCNSIFLQFPLIM